MSSENSICTNLFLDAWTKWTRSGLNVSRFFSRKPGTSPSSSSLLFHCHHRQHNHSNIVIIISTAIITITIINTYTLSKYHKYQESFSSFVHFNFFIYCWVKNEKGEGEFASQNDRYAGILLETLCFCHSQLINGCFIGKFVFLLLTIDEWIYGRTNYTDLCHLRTWKKLRKNKKSKPIHFIYVK